MIFGRFFGRFRRGAFFGLVRLRSPQAAHDRPLRCSLFHAIAAFFLGSIKSSIR